MTHSVQVTKQSPRWQPGQSLHAAYHIAARESALVSRKGSDIPYLSHLLAVSALVIEHGGTHDQAAAGLLHDVLEDTTMSAESLTDELTTNGVPAESASLIVEIVAGTSDGTSGEERSSRTWRERKAAYHASVAAKPSSDPSLLVSLADKVHNLESTLMQVRTGQTLDEIFANFNADAIDQRWNYERLYELFAEHASNNAQLERLIIRFRHALHEVFPR